MNTEMREARPDHVHELLRAAIGVPETSYLWVKGDTPEFTPVLCDTIWGDGRALFALATINQRPRYYVIRGDSRWSCHDSPEDRPDFVDFVDDILIRLEEQFGSGRCNYSGSSLFWSVDDRECECEYCKGIYGDDGEEIEHPEPVAEWPMVDGYGGCSWSRMEWPRLSGEHFEEHPWSWRANLLVRWLRADMVADPLSTEDRADE